MKIQKSNIIFILLLGNLSLGSLSSCNFKNDNGEIQIQWIEDLKGDYGFTKLWDYPEGIFRNEFGQLSCDGICPEGIESLIDKNGKIYSDSISKFYQIVDTTHQFHSIKCDAWCYEWAGTNNINAKRDKNGIACITSTNSGTHCALILEIQNGSCKPRIELNSIRSPETKTYYCKSGYIKVDKELWSKNIIKAEFDFSFDNTDEPDKQMYWKGKTYIKVDDNK